MSASNAATVNRSAIACADALTRVARILSDDRHTRRVLNHVSVRGTLWRIIRRTATDRIHRRWATLAPTTQ
ncbi:hypothetical protein GOSPT_124_00090 [Gordonia sputi NBRC 100414]|uniref:Uncharacterized protein n=1 Tax=Gordonia sputi NBRC 100414 TaxID=1089453 RepID=H5U660_9ACTN|nr:hypothetical protein GOSPT_124_00090 [Gordonia sputi NBRC 100414]